MSKYAALFPPACEPSCEPYWSGWEEYDEATFHAAAPFDLELTAASGTETEDELPEGALPSNLGDTGTNADEINSRSFRCFRFVRSHFCFRSASAAFRFSAPLMASFSSFR